MPKPKVAETDTGVLPGDEAKYAAATPEQRARYHAAVDELMGLLDEADANADKVIAGGGKLPTHDDAFTAAKVKAREKLRQGGI